MKTEQEDPLCPPSPSPDGGENKTASTTSPLQLPSSSSPAAKQSSSQVQQETIRELQRELLGESSTSPLRRGMNNLSLSRSQHTEISYYSSVDGAEEQERGRLEPTVLKRASSKASMSSCTSAFTIGELGPIESVSSLECDDVEYAVDDISVDKNKHNKSISEDKGDSQNKNNIREIFCRTPSKSSLNRNLLSSPPTSPNKISDEQQKSDRNNMKVIEETKSSDSLDATKLASKEKSNKIDDDEDGLLMSSSEPPPRKERFHGSFAFGAIKHKDGKSLNIDDENDDDLISELPILRHCQSGSNIDSNHFPPELDFATATKMWHELAEGVPEVSKTEEEVIRNSGDGQTKVPNNKTPPPPPVSRTPASFLSYDYTEETIEEEDCYDNGGREVNNSTPSSRGWTKSLSSKRNPSSRGSLVSSDFTEVTYYEGTGGGNGLRTSTATNATSKSKASLVSAQSLGREIFLSYDYTEVEVLEEEEEEVIEQEIVEEIIEEETVGV